MQITSVRLACLLAILFVAAAVRPAEAVTSYIWQPVEITLESENTYANPYTNVTVWVDLEGPDFKKRVYGFWDGGKVFKVRFVGNDAGEWTWASGSNQAEDNGLNGRTGTLELKAWMDPQLLENPNRRGILRPTDNGRALQYADGTPFFLVGDTWWAASTWRLPYRGERAADDYSPGPGISFEELVSYRKKQHFNSINIIASFANWDADELPSRYRLQDGPYARAGWEKFGHMAASGDMWTIKDMHDEEGNRPFAMLEDVKSVPDYDRLKPAYFQSLDRKMRHLWDEGFIAFLEPARRDSSPAWATYFDFNSTYARFLNYIVARYGAYNLIFSGIHLDAIPKGASLQADEYNAALNFYFETYGPPPFGQPMTTLITRSTYQAFGHGDSCPWLTMHSVGNFPRDNRMTDYLEELFNLDPPYPVVNLEPYYVAWRTRPGGERPPVNSERDNYFARAQMYGSVLSGALSGHVFGHAAYDMTTTGEPKGDRPYIWEALRFEAGAQMQFLKTFMLSEGDRYRDLRLAGANIDRRVAPGSKTDGLDGMAFMMRTAEKDLGFLYFENQSLRAGLTGFRPRQSFQWQWFDPRSGNWVGQVDLESDSRGTIRMPAFPGGLDIAQTDWAAKLKQKE